MFSVSVDKSRLKFSAAHFLVSHEKCGRLHGHNYRVRVGVKGDLDEKGMLVDFGSLTDKTWEVCQEMDQKVIVPSLNPDMAISRGGEEIRVLLPDREYVLPKSDVLEIPVRSATAEELAAYIFRRVNEGIGGLDFVEIEETRGSAARFEPGKD